MYTRLAVPLSAEMTPLQPAATPAPAPARTGMNISTLLAKLRVLNCERHLTMYSTRERPCASMTVPTQMSGLTAVLRRYDMSSNSPSGGMKLMDRSLSKRVKRTHWWNLMSSSSIAFLAAAPSARPCASNMALSFRPSFSSGMPVSWHFILMAPMISLLMTLPLAAMRQLSFSTTSR